MKVPIKPYISFMRLTWRITDKIRPLFPFVSDKSYDEFQEKFTESKFAYFIDNIFEKYNNYKESKRVKVHIDEYDIWSFDGTLAHIILPGLIMLKDKKIGAPFVEDKDVPKRLRSTSDKDFDPKNTRGETDKFFFERWDYVMGEMIFAFECILDDNYEYDKVKEKRKQKGLELFGKYFTSLWN